MFIGKYGVNLNLSKKDHRSMPVIPKYYILLFFKAQLPTYSLKPLFVGLDLLT